MTSQAPDPKWLATFSALSEIPLKYTDRGEALQKITDLVKDAMGSHACTLVLVDPERRVLTQAAGSGASEEFERFMRTREVRLGSPQEGASIHYDLLARGEAVVRYNLDNDGQGIANRDVARRYGLTAGLMFPLKSNGRVRGYLNHFLSQSRPFTEDEERVLGIFAHQAENILERFEQYQSQERLRKILNDLSQSLLNQPPDVFIREVPRKACELLRVPTCVVWQRDDDAGALTIVSATDDVDEEYRKVLLQLDLSDSAAYLAQPKVGYLADVTQPSAFYQDSEKAKAQGWVSLLSAPMHVDGQLVGMVDVYTHHARTFSVEEKEQFATFANQAAIALQKVELLRETNVLRRRQHIADELNRVAGNEMPGAFHQVTALCTEALQADTCYLRLWDKATDELHLKAAFDKSLKAEDRLPLEHYSLWVGEGIAGHVAQSGRTILCRDTSTETRYKETHQRERLLSILCVPLKFGEEVIGTLSVGSRTRGAFRPHDQRFLENVSGSVVIAIERTQLMESLTRLAEITTSSDRLQLLLDTIAKLTQDLMRVPICVLWLLDKDKNGFRPQAFTGPEEQWHQVKDLFISTEMVKAFLRRQQPLHFRNISTLSWNPNGEKLKDLGWKSILALNRTTKDWHRSAPAATSRVVRSLNPTARSFYATNNESGHSPD